VAETRTTFRTCPLCEAMCGLAVETRDSEIVAVRGDRDDVFSAGYACPKGLALHSLHEDPDRLRQPQVRRADRWYEVSFDDAFGEIESHLLPIRDRHGPHSIAVYLGNPNVHDHAASIYNRVLLRAIGTDQRYSASTVDQMPKQVASGLLFGDGLTVAVPDIDRTDYLLVLGANPLVSNGSLFSAPGLPARIAGLRRRGGRLVVVDPRRTRTAAVADWHLRIRPGTDALLLAAMVWTLFDEGRVDLGAAAPFVTGVADVASVVRPYRPDVVAGRTGIPAAAIRRLAEEVATASCAAVYGRIGTTTNAYGTLTSWLVDVVNTLTGNLDRPGGVMFPRAAAGAANTTGRPQFGRGIRVPGSRRTRVRGLASVLGELPVAALAEEIDTPGADRVRALVTVAGNPLRSTPNTARLERALGLLDYMVSVDLYRNETTSRADVILPAPSPLERDHYDMVFTQLAVRNVARWSPPVFESPGPDEGAILLRLASVFAGVDVGTLDDLVVGELAASATADASSAVFGRAPAELVAALGGRRGAARVLDLLVRTGPYGDGFGACPAGLTLDRLAEAAHGIDLGSLEPRLPEVLRTSSGMVELAPPALVSDMARLQGLLDEDPGLVLVGRRDLRSNNSWMHNLEPLVRGEDRCVLHVHPDDAAPLGLATGTIAELSSRVGTLRVPVVVTDDVLPGVVSLPHGWGHGDPAVEMSTARRHAGVDANRLTDEHPLDPLSGTAVLNGIPVRLDRVPGTTESAAAQVAQVAQVVQVVQVAQVVQDRKSTREQEVAPPVAPR